MTSPVAVRVTRRIDSTVGEHPRLRVEVVEGLREVLQRDRAPELHPPGGRRQRCRPAAPAPTTSRRRSRRRCRPGRPGPSRQVAWDSSVRSPRTRSTSSTSITSLPSRCAANRWSSSRSRGGGSSAIRASAASMRNFGFEVRAGGPRRSQASSLRARLRRRTSVAAAWRSPLRLGQHVRRVAAVVGVDDAVVHLPGALADRVEEPPVVRDHDQRRRQRRPGARPARRPPRRRGGWSARRGPAGRARAAAARPGRSGGARRRRARSPRGRARRPPAAR